MLNSQQLADLKIQALASNSTNQNRHFYFNDLGQAFATHSADHTVIEGSPNANILAFSFVLLSHIFQFRGSASQHNSSNGSPSSQINNNSSGSMSIDRTASANNPTKIKQKQQGAQNYQKLKKIYQYLLSSKVNFSEIVNIPIAAQQALQNAIQDKSKRNNYLKKLLVQFIKKVHQCSINSSSPRNSGKQQYNFGNKKISVVASLINNYPLSQFLLEVFIRSILFCEYQIVQAQDYSKQISDHTVYTALCDAFFYSSLHIQQKYTQITSGALIRLLRMKRKRQNHRQEDTFYYLVSLPQNKSDITQMKEGIESNDTFRVRKKSSDVSNSQTISFRQNSKPNQVLPIQANPSIVQKTNNQTFQLKIQDQIQKFNNEDRNNLSSQQSSPYFKQNPQQPVNETSTRNNSNKQLVNSQQNISKSETMIANSRSIFSEAASPNGKIEQKQKKLEKSHSHNFIRYSERNSLAPALNGYTSLQILKQLNPSVRDHMVETIGHFKKYKI